MPTTTRKSTAGTSPKRVGTSRSTPPSLATKPTPATRKQSAATPSVSPPAATSSHERVVLLAVTGMSPAILTETVWALATDKESPCVPHEVIVVTTSAGKALFERELLQPSPLFGGVSCWDALRAALAKKFPVAADRLILDDFKVLTAPDAATGRVRQLEDIRTRADSDAAANFILKEVRAIVNNPDCRLVASLAGGRKTMVALLYGCMSLLGRSQDRLTHVLVSQPFDEPGLTPRFYFPTIKPVAHELKDRAGNVVSRHSSTDAKIELGSVPFVCLRNLFTKELRRPAGDFTALANRYADKIAQLAGPPEVKIETTRSAIIVNEVPVTNVPTRALGLFVFLARRCQLGDEPYARVGEAVADLKSFLPEWTRSLPEGSAMREEAAKWLSEGGVFEEELNRKVSNLKSRFEDAGLQGSFDFLLPRKKAFGIRVRLLEQVAD
jgi:CRISPR-associated protein (TIGR02584 family)